MGRGDGTDVYQDGADVDCACEGVRNDPARSGLVNYLALRNGQYIYIPDVCFRCRILQCSGGGSKSCPVSDPVPRESWLVGDVCPVSYKEHLRLYHF